MASFAVIKLPLSGVLTPSANIVSREAGILRFGAEYVEIPNNSVKVGVEQRYLFGF
jgi:hypothetical protein